MSAVLVNGLANHVSDFGDACRDHPFPSISIEQLASAIADLLVAADQIAPFMHAQYPDAEGNAFRRSHYALQSATGKARELVRRLADDQQPRGPILSSQGV